MTSLWLMGSTFPWSLVPLDLPLETVDPSRAPLILTDNAQVRYGPQVGAITRARYSRPRNTVALMGPVGLQIIRDFSRTGAMMLIVILKMIQQALLLARVGLLTTGLCFAH